MAFVAITTDEITTGEPVMNGMLTKVKNNFDTLDTRVTAVEGGSAVVYPPLVFSVSGEYDSLLSERILKTTMNFNLTITGVRILIDRAGTLGTTEIDMLYRRAGGIYTSVLTTRPSVAYTAGNDAVSSNAVLNLAEVALQTGDILAIDLTSVQTGGVGFYVRVDYNKT